MGCYLMVTNWSLGCTAVLSMEKAGESAAKVSSKTVKEVETA